MFITFPKFKPAMLGNTYVDITSIDTIEEICHLKQLRGKKLFKLINTAFGKQTKEKQFAQKSIHKVLNQ